MMLAVDNLTVSFHTRGGVVRAVRGISFGMRKGETLGIVGESGSGKTALAHALLRLHPQPPARVTGTAIFGDDDLLSCGDTTLRTIRGNRICMVFQDPSASFNPYLRIADQMAEPLMLHRSIKRGAALEIAATALGETGIIDPARRIRSYPHEFSGGMLQRAMIAMALMMRPDIVLADEPTTALDVTVQAQLLKIMKNLRDRHGLTILFITHNLGIVKGFCDRVLVMYAGVVLESAPATVIFTSPMHPYTRALLRSVPRLRGDNTQLDTIPGAPPDPTEEHAGCPFAPRCAYRIAVCDTAPLRLVEIDAGHETACIRVQQGDVPW